MGGVHFVPQEDGQVMPLLWRSPFPRAIHEHLVSFNNPAGDINNSELELAVSVARNEILAQKFGIQEPTIHIFFWQCSHNMVAAKGRYVFDRPHYPHPAHSSATSTPLPLCTYV
jgi:hypothetical protein